MYVHPLHQAWQGVLIAHQCSNAADQMAYVAVQHAMGTMGAILADRDVCALDESLARALRLPTAERRILLSYNQLRHIMQRHEVSVAGDPDVITRRIATALSTPRYVRKQRTAHEWAIICLLADASRHIQIALKFVNSSSARSHRDELWVATAFYVGQARLNRLLRKGDLCTFGEK